MTRLTTTHPSIPRRPEAVRGRLHGGALAALAIALLLAGCTTPPVPSSGNFPPDEPAPPPVAMVPDRPLEPGPPRLSGLPPGINATFPSAPPAPGPRVPVPPPAAPASLSVQRINGTDYVDVAAFFARLGLRAIGTPGGTRATFQGGGHRADLEGGEREMTLDNLKVFLGEPALLRTRVLYVSRIDAEKLLRPILAPPRLAAPRVIVLDPGHGGGDPGMQNRTLGLDEKKLTLDVAQRLKPLLEARGWRVVLTRSDDRELSPVKAIDLLRRSELANREHADLFVSIHFNSVAPDTRTSGTEVYRFPPQFQRSATSWGAGQDDDAERHASPVNRNDAGSAVLAYSLQRSLLASLGTVDRGQKLKHLGVLRGLDCPGVLVECVFLSSDTEARRASAPAYRQQIALSLAEGIAAYAAQVSPAP